MSRTGHGNPAVLIHHVGAQQGNNMVAVDVWESEEAFKKFSEVLMPIFVMIRVTPVQPVITPILYEQSGIKNVIPH